MAQHMLKLQVWFEYTVVYMLVDDINAFFKLVNKDSRVTILTTKQVIKVNAKKKFCTAANHNAVQHPKA